MWMEKKAELDRVSARNKQLEKEVFDLKLANESLYQHVKNVMNKKKKRYSKEKSNNMLESLENSGKEDITSLKRNENQDNKAND